MHANEPVLVKGSTLPKPTYDELDSNASDENAAQGDNLSFSIPVGGSACCHDTLASETDDIMGSPAAFNPRHSLFIQSVQRASLPISVSDETVDDVTQLVSDDDTDEQPAILNGLGPGRTIGTHGGFCQSTMIRHLFTPGARAERRAPPVQPRHKARRSSPVRGVPLTPGARPSGATSLTLQDRVKEVDDYLKNRDVLRLERSLAEERRRRERLRETVQRLTEDNDRLRSLVTYNEIQRADEANARAREEDPEWADPEPQDVARSAPAGVGSPGAGPGEAARSRHLTIELDRLRGRLTASEEDLKRETRRATEGVDDADRLRKKLSAVQKAAASASSKHRVQMAAAAKKFKAMKQLISTLESDISDRQTYTARLERKLIEQQRYVVDLQGKLRRGPDPTPTPTRPRSARRVPRSDASIRPTLTTATAHDRSPARAPPTPGSGVADSVRVANIVEEDEAALQRIRDRLDSTAGDTSSVLESELGSVLLGDTSALESAFG